MKNGRRDRQQASPIPPIADFVRQRRMPRDKGKFFQNGTNILSLYGLNNVAVFLVHRVEPLHADFEQGPHLRLLRLWAERLKIQY
jgi:hypothetical protein